MSSHEDYSDTLLVLSKKKIIKADPSQYQTHSPDDLDQPIVFTKLWCDNVDPVGDRVSSSDVEAIQNAMDAENQSQHKSDPRPSRTIKKDKGSFSPVVPVDPTDQIGIEHESGLAR